MERSTESMFDTAVAAMTSKVDRTSLSLVTGDKDLDSCGGGCGKTSCEVNGQKVRHVEGRPHTILPALPTTAAY